MAFNPPTFNLTCNVWTGQDWPLPAPRLSPRCNLAWGKRVQSAYFGSDEQQPPFTSALLLLSSGTDIRDTSCLSFPLGNTVGQDIVEVPAGSGRYYYAIGVDDIGKGFSNEHRAAWLAKIISTPPSLAHNVFTGFPPWPIPIP